MSQKPFDHIENKIKEAAAKLVPFFNEAAWQKMELLLDKEDRKKRLFFIWRRIGLPLLILALVVGGTIFSYQSSSKSKQLNTVKQNNTNSNTKIKHTTINKTSSIITQNKEDETVPRTKNLLKINDTFLPKKTVPIGIAEAVNSYNLNPANVTKKQKFYKKGNAFVTIENIVTDEYTKLTKKENNKNLMLQHYSDNADSVNKVNIIIEEKAVDSTKSSTSKLNKKDSTEDIKIEISNKSTATKKVSTSRFYLLAAAGADIAGVRFLSFENSTLQSRYGFAFGYQLNKKFSVQAGLYAGRKIYTGGPDDYHAKQGSYWSTVKLNKVEGSCLVYDIPLSIRCEVIQKKQLNFYAVIGISSFIMKKEDYNYFYTAYNTNREKKYSYTGNQHLFSNLLISAGVEKSITAALSVQAEPYLSIPLKGVGDGMVKLYSAGLMFGIKYKPNFKLAKKRITDKK